MVDILSLRRPTKISKLIEDIPNHPYSLPRTVLPGWKHLPLNQKLPITKTPLKTLYFRRNKTGESLWQKNNDDFEFYDPNLYRFKFKYDPLSDQHLKKFFRQLVFKERILYHRLIDCNFDEVLCSLKDFNNYRSYLYQLQLYEIHRQIKNADLRERDKLWLKRIEDWIQKVHEKERIRSLYPRREDVLKRLHRARKRFLAKRIRYYKNRILVHSEENEAKIRELREKKALEWAIGWLKRKRLREFQRLKMIKLSLRIQKKFRHHREIATRQAKEKQELAESKTKETWIRRLQSREKQTKLNQQLLEQHENQFRKNVEKRSRILERAQEKSRQQFEKSRANQIRKRYEHFHRDKVKEKFFKGIQKIFLKKRRRCKRMSRRVSQKSSKSVRTSKSIKNSNDLDLIEEAFKRLKRLDAEHAVDRSYETHESMQTLISSHSVLETAREILQMIIETPDPMLPDDKFVLNYTKNRIHAMIESIKAEVLTDLKKISQSETTFSSKRSKKSKSTSFNPSLQSEDPTIKTTSSKRVKIEENNKVVEITPSYKKIETLKSAINRPPTPVASLESIVAVIIAAEPEEPPIIPHDYDHFDLLHITKTQKVLLERNFILIKKLMKNCVSRQCLFGIKTKIKKAKMCKKKMKKNIVTQEQVEKTLARLVLKLPTNEAKLGQKLGLACKVISNDILFTFKEEVCNPEVKPEDNLA